MRTDICTDGRKLRGSWKQCGVGLSVDIPTFNLNEVIDVTRNLIHHPNADVVLIPDHCQPCEIIDTDWKKISDTGEGSYRVRGIVEIGEVKEKKETYPALFIKSLPNGVTTKVVTDALYKMIESKQLPMIKDINDETKNKVDITIVLKKGTDPYYVREVLYVKTKVQDNCSVNFEVVHGLNPKRMGYKEYLLNFIKQRKETKFRIYCNKMQAAMTRFLELDAYIKFMKSGEIDNIYNMIRKQKNIGDTELVEYMIKKCGITDIQSAKLDRELIKSEEALHKELEKEKNKKMFAAAKRNNDKHRIAAKRGKLSTAGLPKSVQSVVKKVASGKIKPKKKIRGKKKI